MTCSYLMAQDQALKIWQRKLSIAVATLRQLPLLAQSEAFCASNGLRLGRALCQRYTRKKQEENHRKSSSESLQLWPRAWKAVKPETKLWSVPATRTRQRQRSTYQSSLCHHGRPTIRVPYTLGFPPKHRRTARY